MQYEIRVPRDQERDALAAAGLIQDLCDLFVPELGGVQFHIDNVEGKANYKVILPLRQDKPGDPKTEYAPVPVEEVTAIVRRFYPRAQVEGWWWDDPVIPSHQRMMRFVRSKSPVGDFQPYLTFDRVRGSDPLSGLARLMAKTPEVDTASYGVMVLTPRITEFKLNKTMLWGARLLNYAANNKDPWAMHDNMRRERDTLDARAYKAAEGSLAVIPYVAYLSPEKNRLQSADALAQVMMQFPQDIPFARDFIRTDKTLKQEDDGAFMAAIYFIVNDLTKRNQGTRYSAEDDVYLMTPRELATIWHLPDKTYPEEYIHWVDETPCRELPEPLRRVTEGVLVGINQGCDQDQTVHEVRQPITDRVMHTLILGRVGTGKSALMYRMICEDIKAGRGVVVVDPHGGHEEGLIRWLLARGIPPHRLQDVVIIDLTNITKNPPPINPLLSASTNQHVSSDFVATLSRVYEDDDLNNTRMADWLRLALRTVGLSQDATLSDVRRVLRDEGFRYSLLQDTDEMSLLEDWEDFKRADRQENSIGGILTRVRRFMERNETIAMVCHPKPLHYGKLAAQGKIILVSAGGAVSPLSEKERMVLSSVVVSQILDGAFAGLYKNPVTMYIDETRNFVNAPIDEMLREVRKFNLGLVLSSQGMSALSTKMQHAIDESVATLIGFEMAEDDAKMFKPYIHGVYTTDELQRLGRFTAAVSMRYKGERMQAFELHTLPPFDENAVAVSEAEVRRASVENYMPMGYNEVLEAYRTRYQSNNHFGHDEPINDDEYIKRP